MSVCIPNLDVGVWEADPPNEGVRNPSMFSPVAEEGCIGDDVAEVSFAAVGPSLEFVCERWDSAFWSTG